MYGHYECLEVLLTAGSNVNATDEKGWTALHWAAYHGKLRCLETLIRYKNICHNVHLLCYVFTDHCKVYVN